MAKITPDDITVGMRIKYSSINKFDENIYIGKVISLCDSEIAMNFTDIVDYNADVKKDTPSILEIKYLKFFILKNEVNNSLMAFANKWISPDSLVEIVTPKTASIVIYQETAKGVQNAVELLISKNFILCKSG